MRTETITIGDRTLIHGDCIKVEIPPSALVITDPPYGVVTRKSNGLRDLHKGVSDEETCSTDDILRVVSGGDSVYIWCATEQASGLRSGLADAGRSTRLCIWEKSNPSPMNCQHLWLSSVECCIYGKGKGAVFNEFYASPVWRGAVAKHKELKTPKPVWLMKRLIEASSNPGDLVVDPFMGGGSTGIACAETGRRFFGVEKNRRVFDIACRRIADAYNSQTKEPQHDISINSK